MSGDIRAVAFDAYGTLCYIADRTHPLAALTAKGSQAASTVKRLCMTRPLILPELLDGLGSVSPANLAAIEEKVQREVASVRLFDDVVETLEYLRGRGMRLGLISNLASPYAPPLQTLLGDRIDAYVWSFEVGAVKPEPAIFAALCQRIGLLPNQVLMVGDSNRADVEGAQQFGMPVLHLARNVHQRAPQSLKELAEVIAWLDTHSSTFKSHNQIGYFERKAK